MKIFKIEGFGHYSGGVVLVAANTKREAVEVANEQSHNSHWSVKYSYEDTVLVNNIQYTGNSDKPVVLLHYEMGE